MITNFAELWTIYRDSLESQGAVRLPLAAELANRDGRTGKIHLHAEQWRLGRYDARLVFLQGAASEILNVLLFPEDGEGGPVFVTEFLSTGHTPRLVFVDVQVPGVGQSCQLRIARELEQKKQLTQLPEAADAPPEWASRYSTGNYTWSRPNDGGAFAACGDTFGLYWDAWRTLRHVSGEADAITQYKRMKADHWPGRDYMHSVFGATWSEEFAERFLYA